MISSANGVNALGKGMEILKGGGDTLEAAVAAVTVVEDDPNDDSVGYGGLPNEEGVVELDASVMHGPTRRAGSVASVQKIKNVARLAKTVMERTNHVMIVGDGARRFGVAEGFEEMNLHRISLVVYSTNTRAHRAYSKVGFVEEGRSRRVHFVGGRYLDEIHWAGRPGITGSRFASCTASTSTS